MNTGNKIHEYLDELSPKNILDFGGGKGRILNLFVNKSSNIICVDKKDFKDVLPKNIDFIQEDIRDFKTEEYFDLIIFSMVLHFLKKNEAIELIKRMKERTNPGGYNFILCMSNQEERKMEENFYPSLNELKESYTNWDIKSEEFETDIEEHDGLPPHKHNLIIFLAGKK